MKTAMQSSFDDKTLIHVCFHSDLLDFSYPFQSLSKIFQHVKINSITQKVDPIVLCKYTFLDGV